MKGYLVRDIDDNDEVKQVFYLAASPKQAALKRAARLGAAYDVSLEVTRLQDGYSVTHDYLKHRRYQIIFKQSVKSIEEFE